MSLACRRHGHRLDLCLERAAEGLWPQSSGAQLDGGPDSSPGGFFVVPLPPASEPERPPNKGTSRRRGRRRSRSFSLGRRWTRRLLPHLSPGPAGFGGEPGRGLWTLRGRRSPPRKVQVNLLFSRGSRSRNHHEGP